MAGHLAEAIRQAVAASGRTQADIAAQAKVSAPELSRFIRGERSMNSRAVERLCEVLGLELRPVRKPKRKGK
jgi:transcriptional regulator with XRE-family HTH domain